MEVPSSSLFGFISISPLSLLTILVTMISVLMVLVAVNYLWSQNGGAVEEKPSRSEGEGDGENSGTQTRKSSTADEAADTVPSRAITPTMLSRRRPRSRFFSNILQRQRTMPEGGDIGEPDRGEEDLDTGNRGRIIEEILVRRLPHILQRRHSAMFPLVQEKFNAKLQAAREMYDRTTNILAMESSPSAWFTAFVKPVVITRGANDLIYNPLRASLGTKNRNGFSGEKGKHRLSPQTTMDLSLFGRSGGYKRQFSEMGRVALPQPPSEFFEPSAEKDIPDEFKPMFYIHQCLRLLELPSDWILEPEHIEMMEFDYDQYVAKSGDDDDSIYVVLEGALAVYITPPEGKDCMVKQVNQGNSFFSLLSMIDILMQVPSYLKTVSLKAISPKRTRVAKYNMKRFRPAYEANPSLWSRPLQITMTRLLHVTMTTLHQHMGLGEELLRRRVDDARQVGDEFRQRNVSGHSMKNPLGKRRPRNRRLSSSDEGSEQVNRAIRIFAEAMRLPASEAQQLLQPRIELVQLSEDQIVVGQGCQSKSAHLYVCLNGALKVSQDSPFEADESLGDDPSWQRIIPPKELLGGLQLLSNEPAFFTIKAAVPNTTIARISKENFDQLVELTNGSIVLPVAFTLLRRLSSFLRAVDFALDWIMLDSGQTVYRDGDSAESLFVVLSGRLRSVSNKVAIEEFGRGDVLGMMEVLQKKPRNTTVLAIRYSQLARVPEGLLNFIKMQYPQVGFRLVRLLGHYYDNRRGMANGIVPALGSGMQTTSQSDPMNQIKNLHTICVFAASEDVPLISFTCELYHALNATTKVLRLSSQRVAEELGESVLEKAADFRLMHWLNIQEDNFALCIYECDFAMSNWTRRCLRQADAILVVANGELLKPPQQQLIDEHFRLKHEGIRTRKELVLLWRDDVSSPVGTVEWLKGSWFSGHHHVRAPKRMYQWEGMEDERNEAVVLSYYDEFVFPGKADFNSDFSRISRILTGNAVGLVLGGGGARGAAHVGVIRALREQGIPVDIVGGTSIGSLIGGIYAGNHPSEYWNKDLETRAQDFFMVMTSLWRKLWDLTWSYTSMFTGAGFNYAIKGVLGDKLIEDLWLNYFCITTDINTSEMRVHRAGPLWAYVRASMSLAGYLPPLCDPVDGHYLLDGGYVNNLPADVMRSMGARCIIAVDVGAATEVDLYNYGDSLSGFWVLARVLFQKLNPWAKPVRILGMEEIQSRLAFVSSARQLDSLKKANYCHYLRPPWLERYKTLEFHKFDEIRSLGHEYSSEKIGELVKTNANLKSVVNPDKLRVLARTSTLREQSPSMGNSFTDLAAQISRIPQKRYISLTDLNAMDSEGEFDEFAAELQLRRKKLENGVEESGEEEEDGEETGREGVVLTNDGKRKSSSGTSSSNASHRKPPSAPTISRSHSLSSSK